MQRDPDNLTLAPRIRVWILMDLLIQMLKGHAANFWSLESDMPDDAKIVGAKLVTPSPYGGDPRDLIVELTLESPSFELADPREPPLRDIDFVRHYPTSTGWEGPLAMQVAYLDLVKPGQPGHRFTLEPPEPSQTRRENRP